MIGFIEFEKKSQRVYLSKPLQVFNQVVVSARKDFVREVDPSNKSIAIEVFADVLKVFSRNTNLDHCGCLAM